MRASTRARFAFCLLALVPACVSPEEQAAALDDQDPHQPGEAIGLFSVDGSLDADGCGAANLSAPEAWTFEVKLSKQGRTLYWLNGREAIVGDIDANGRFAFETHIEVVLAPKRGAAKGCTMVRRDAASGTLSGDAALRGKLSYSYEATAESDCTEYALGAEGTPLTLPCSLTYALRGQRLD
jgi:hypothetical protein